MGFFILILKLLSGNQLSSDDDEDIFDRIRKHWQISHKKNLVFTIKYINEKDKRNNCNLWLSIMYIMVFFTHASVHAMLSKPGWSHIGFWLKISRILIDKPIYPLIKRKIYEQIYICEKTARTKITFEVNCNKVGLWERFSLKTGFNSFKTRWYFNFILSETNISVASNFAVLLCIKCSVCFVTKYISFLQSLIMTRQTDRQTDKRFLQNNQ